MAGGFFTGGSSAPAASGGVAEAEEFAIEAGQHAETAEDWAAGSGTDPAIDSNTTLPDPATDPGDTNNSRYYARLARQFALNAETNSIEDLNDLSDVTVATPLEDQFLRFNGSMWVNEAVTIPTVGNGTITLVEGNGITLSANPSFSLNQGDNESITISASGAQPSEHLNIALSPTSLTTSSPNTTPVTVTLSASGNGTLSNQDVTVFARDNTTEIMPAGSGNSWSFTANDNSATGHYRIVATATLDGQTVTRTAYLEVTTPVATNDWFSWLRTTVPSSNSDTTDQSDNGVWSGSGSVQFTTDGTSADRAYIALPTRASGYNFGGDSSFILKFTATAVTSGYTQTDYTLYELSTDDVDPTQSGTITVFVGDA